MLMKVFISQLQRRTLLSAEGTILGTIDNFVVDTKNGHMKHVLVIPTPELDTAKFRMDASGRLVLPGYDLLEAGEQQPAGTGLVRQGVKLDEGQPPQQQRAGVHSRRGSSTFERLGGPVRRS